MIKKTTLLIILCCLIISCGKKGDPEYKDSTKMIELNNVKIKII